MEAFLDLVAQRRINTDALITHRYPIEQAERAYEFLTGKAHGPYIGLVLQYDLEKVHQPGVVLDETAVARRTKRTPDEVRFGVIGAGQFAQGVLLPRLAAQKGVTLRSFATGSGLTARAVAEKYPGCLLHLRLSGNPGR